MKYQSELDFSVWVPGRGNVKWRSSFYAEPDRPIRIGGDTTLAYFLEVALFLHPPKLPLLAPGARYTYQEIGNDVMGLRVRGLNAHGAVAGRIYQKPQKGFLWQKGLYTELLSFPGGSEADPYALNNVGQVVGKSTLANGQSHACLWENGRAIDLGTLDGMDRSVALAINDRGQIVGYAYDSHSLPAQVTPDHFEACSRRRAFFWEKGRMSALPTSVGANSEGANLEGANLEGANAVSAALDINSSGQIAGYVCQDSAIGPTRAVVWEGGKLRELEALSPEQATTGSKPLLSFTPDFNGYRALRINDAGMILGWAKADNGPHFSQAAQADAQGAGLHLRRGTALVTLLWKGNRPELPDLRLTGYRCGMGILPSGEAHSGFAALNNRGDLLGRGYAPANPHGYQCFLLQDGLTRTLPLGGEPVAINDAGQILLYNSFRSVLLTPTEGTN